MVTKRKPRKYTESRQKGVMATRLRSVCLFPYSKGYPNVIATNTLSTSGIIHYWHGSLLSMFLILVMQLKRIKLLKHLSHDNDSLHSPSFGMSSHIPRLRTKCRNKARNGNFICKLVQCNP